MKKIIDNQLMEKTTVVKIKQQQESLKSDPSSKLTYEAREREKRELKQFSQEYQKELSQVLPLIPLKKIPSFLTDLEAQWIRRHKFREEQIKDLRKGFEQVLKSDKTK